MSTHDISVNYLGLDLRSPIVPSASPLSEHLDSLLEMETCGAGAVVLPTLFEFPIKHNSFHPNYYFERIIQAKKTLKIPVIASLNACSDESWHDLAGKIQEAGADAIELNIYHMSLSPNVPSAQVEAGYVNVVKTVASAVSIPIAVKLPPFFTNLSYLAKDIKKAGASGFVLFNRFYQPDIDLLSMSPSYTLRLSTSSDNRLPLRWISLLYQNELGYLAASTGIRTGDNVLKMILSGASVTQVCSILMQRGIPWIKYIEEDLHRWMDICKIHSLKESLGLLSHRCMKNPGQIERDEYMKALQGYSQIDVPSWKDEIPLHAEAEAVAK